MVWKWRQGSSYVFSNEIYKTIDIFASDWISNIKNIRKSNYFVFLILCIKYLSDYLIISVIVHKTFIKKHIIRTKTYHTNLIKLIDLWFFKCY